ncbi:MAG TPA: XRE family transcriptional regulator [Nitriliruptoraceae bacterium]|nr:XRE family transcriptional regulator [Nitriliruptoraceae bacterium]
MDAADLATVIGDNVRRLRDVQGLSQDALADVADLSKGTVVAIEAQRSNPSVATLCALSEALGVGLSGLLEPPSGPLVKVRRADEAITLWTTTAGSRADLLLGTDPPNAIEVWEWHIEAGDAFDGTAHPRDTVECLRVLAGNLDVTVGGTHMVGAPGDTIAFEAHEPHRYAASGDSPVRFTMWITVGDVGGLPSVTAMGSH